MRQVLGPGEYSFDASAKTVTFLIAPIPQEHILGIWNVTSGQKMIYYPQTAGFGGTVAGSVLTLDFDTTAMNDTDILLVFWEDPTILASNLTLGAVLAKLSGDPSTETTLAAVLAKLIAAPATEAKQDTGNGHLSNIRSFIGETTEVAPANDTADSALNGRLQRIAQNITTLINAFNAENFATEATLAALNTVVNSALANEDGASVDSDRGFRVLAAIRKGTPADLSGTDGDYEFLQLKDGRLYVRVTHDGALAAGSAIIGKVGIDQTTPGSTNAVEVIKHPKSSTANTPSIVTTAGDVLSSNTSRKSWSVQNLGTNTLYVRMATGASTSVFHFALAPGASNDDGRGGIVSDDIFTGVVSIAGTSPRCVVSEL